MTSSPPVPVQGGAASLPIEHYELLSAMAAGAWLETRGGNNVLVITGDHSRRIVSAFTAAMMWIESFITFTAGKRWDITRIGREAVVAATPPVYDESEGEHGF